MSKVGFESVTAISIGLLLTAAATLTFAAGRAPMTAGVVGLTWQRELQALPVILEVVLGGWLVSGYRRLGALLVAIPVFIALLGMSVHSGWAGNDDCGCFGRLKVHPWVTAAIDVFALALLTLAARREWRRVRPSGRTLAVTVLGISVAAVVAVSLAILLRQPAARWLGKSLVAPQTVDFSTQAAGAVVAVPIPFENATAEPIHIMGCSTDCNCMSVSPLPVTVPEGGRASLEIKLTMPRQAVDAYRRPIEIWVRRGDAGRLGRMRIVVTGRVE